MNKKLYRSSTQRMIAGVCGGLAEHFDIDVSVVRLIFAGIALVSAIIPMTIFYIIAVIVVPSRLEPMTPPAPPPAPPPPAS